MAKTMAYRHINLAMMLCAVGCLVLRYANQPSGSRASATHVPAVDSADGVRAEQVAVAPTAFQLSADYVTIDVDVSNFRWLWWPGILYLFWGMAHVCDEYFVRTIDVISERFKIPDDVAGATLMALGCNGPEMALNTISIFHPSNIGVGAVIGGEVFNVLVIIGTALLATPAMYMPLKLGCFNFFRDVTFYMISVALLYWALKGGEISRLNAAVLLSGSVVYTLTVVFSSQIKEFFLRESKALRRTLTQTRKSIKARLSLMPKADGPPAKTAVVSDSEDESDEEEADPQTIAQWQEALRSRDPKEGSVLGVKVDVRNRLMDRNHRVDPRFMCLRDNALVVSTLLDPGAPRSLHYGIAYSHDRQTETKHWHHGGLVNQPIFLPEQEQGQGANDVEGAAPNGIAAAFSATPIDQLSRPLLNGAPKAKLHSGIVSAVADMQSPAPAHLPGFREAPWEIIPLEDILYCERVAEQKAHFNLHVHQHDSNLGALITLELRADDEEVMDAWVQMLQQKLLDQRRTSTEAPPAKGGLALLMQWAEWFQFPVKFFVSLTIPDMDDPKQQHLYPVAFTMSMVWLAVFAFCVVQACEGIHREFGISDDILGFTVAAAGTSFPNVFSGMCVARQGKTSMAVANALGANVQNVFLALAVPWTIQSFGLVGGSFPMRVDNLLPAVLECAITLVPVVLVYLCCGFSMPRWSGGLFLLTYAIYVVFALGQQVTDCPYWPLSCQA